MNILGAKGTSLLMSYTVTEKKIQKIIEKKQILPMSLLEYVAPGNAKVAAVQLEVRRYQKLAEYIDDMEAYIFESLQKTCHMICFPEWTGLLPISLAPECRKDVNLLEALLSPAPEQLSAREIRRFEAQMRQCANFLLECFYTTFSALARRYAAYLCAGGPYVEEGGRYYNRAYLFSPHGEVELVQDKLQPNFLETELGVKGGSAIEVKKTLIGNVAIAIGSDSAYYEYHKIAASLGADMVVTSSAPWERLSDVGDVSGAQLRALESGLYTVCSSMESGKAGIFAPFSRTRDGSGIAAQAESLTGRGSVVSRLYLDKREPQVDIYTDDRNPECYAALLAAAGYEPESRAISVPAVHSPQPEAVPAVEAEVPQEEEKASAAPLWGVDEPQTSTSPLWDEEASVLMQEEAPPVQEAAAEPEPQEGVILPDGEIAALMQEEASVQEAAAKPEPQESVLLPDGEIAALMQEEAPPVQETAAEPEPQEGMLLPGGENAALMQEEAPVQETAAEPEPQEGVMLPGGEITALVQEEAPVQETAAEPEPREGVILPDGEIATLVQEEAPPPKKQKKGRRAAKARKAVEESMQQSFWDILPVPEPEEVAKSERKCEEKMESLTGRGEEAASASAAKVDIESVPKPQADLEESLWDEEIILLTDEEVALVLEAQGETEVVLK